MKLLCVTCMHNRPKVSELFLSNMRRLGVDVLSVVSDNDLPSLEVCFNYDINFILHPNLPLGSKWNKGIEIASTLDEYTHVLLLGDDDIIDPKFLELIEEFQDHPFLGIESTYMIDPFTELALHFRYKKRSKVVCGAGKVIQMSVIKKIVERGGMFDPEANSGLDRYADMMMVGIGNWMPVVLDTNCTVMCGVKTSQNIWGLSNFKYIASEVDYTEATSVFGAEQINLLEKIKKDDSYRNVNVY